MSQHGDWHRLFTLEFGLSKRNLDRGEVDLPGRLRLDCFPLSLCAYCTLGKPVVKELLWKLQILPDSQTLHCCFTSKQGGWVGGWFSFIIRYVTTIAGLRLERFAQFVHATKAANLRSVVDLS
mmetsp:Transcript_26392/g.55870  ORF Transcript_26392/g.55870 Transcript_26392/m.55870 type:complete len:123 (-) Transcript_26392:4-372(-)